MTQNYLVEKNGVFTHSGTHEIAFLYSKKEDKVHEITALTRKAAFLGISPDINSSKSIGKFEMKSGDILVLYTDGAIEAKKLSLQAIWS